MVLKAANKSSSVNDTFALSLEMNLFDKMTKGKYVCWPKPKLERVKIAGIVFQECLQLHKH